MRGQALSDAVAADFVYCDPTVRTVGVDELLSHIDAVCRRRPGSRVIRTGSADCHHDVARFTWAALDAEERVLRKGVDVATFDDEGRISAIVGFFDPI